jgi:hypothetical protein
MVGILNRLPDSWVPEHADEQYQNSRSRLPYPAGLAGTAVSGLIWVLISEGINHASRTFFGEEHRAKEHILRYSQFPCEVHRLVIYIQLFKYPIEW